MAQQQGANASLLLGEESTFKTLATSAIVLPIISESVKSSRNLVESQTLSNGRNPKMPSRGNIDVAGEITMELSPQKACCILLKHALGAVTTTGASSPYTHTFKISTLPTGLSLEKQFTDLSTAKYFQYGGCKLNGMKMSISGEGAAKVSFPVMGCAETVANSSLDSTPEATVLTPFDIFSAAITEGGSSIATVTEVSFDLNNNLEGGIYTIGGAGTRYSIPAGIAVVKGTIKALFDSVALYTKAINHTESSLAITMSLGTGAGTAGNEAIAIYIDELIYQPDAPTISTAAGLMVELPFIAYVGDDADASALRIVVNNSLSSLAIS